MTPIIRRLTESDAAAFRELRLAGLLEAPTAFGSSYAAEKDHTVENFAETIARNYLAGAFLEGQLIGVAGFYQLTGEKVAHRGNIWGVYVDPSHRGAGVARALMGNAMAHARGIVSQVHLSVVTDNEAALGLYERLGYVSYGIEPRALRIGSRFYDEHMMVCRID
ncbi:MAG: N-acetyltransferase [Devosia sp.]|nr:N-acetyltransferase [Devosia sp.]